MASAPFNRHFCLHNRAVLTLIQPQFRVQKSRTTSVFNRLDPSITRMGLDYESLKRINPKAIAVQMSAFKGERPAAYDDYPGYDPILQGQTGIMSRFGSPEAPELHGVASCVDYLCGYLGALGGVVALAAQTRRGDGLGDWADSSLASAGSLIQFPFLLTEPPVGSPECLRKVKDGWICVEPADVNLPDLSNLTVDEALAEAAGAGAIAVKVQSLAELKARHRTNPSATIAFRRVTGKFSVLTVKPTWFYFDGGILPEATEPTRPGSDAPEILGSLGYTLNQIEKLVADGVVGRIFWAQSDSTAMKMGVVA